MVVRSDLARCLIGPRESPALDTVESAARGFGILSEDEEFLHFHDGEPWSRGGAETFTCSATFTLRRGSANLSRRIFAKAYAGFGVGNTPQEWVEIWARRASVLRDNGVNVPTVYGCRDGVILLEHIPFPLERFLDSQASLARQLAQRLDALRVQPLSLLPDLRSDGRRVFLVDFGEDLGPVPGSGAGGEATACLERELYQIHERQEEDECRKEQL